MKIWLAIKASCLIVLTLTLSTTLLEFRGLIRDARISVRMSDSVMGNVNDAAFEVSGITKTAGGALAAETKRLDASTKELQKTEASARLLIVRTNESLNGGPHVRGLLPEATASLGAFEKLTETAATDLDSANRELAPSLTNLARGTAAFADAAADPAIKNTLANVEKASESTAEIARDAKESTDLAEARLKQMLKPASMAKTIFLNLLSVGYQLRGILGL